MNCDVMMISHQAFHYSRLICCSCRPVNPTVWSTLRQQSWMG